VNFTLVSPPDTTPGASTDEYASLYEVGLRELEGVEREELKTFVVPTDGVDAESLAAGAEQRGSFWVQARYSGIDYMGNTPAHEFVHTRMGSFGDESSRWLTEASAEYYGYLLTLNTARGTWSEFQEALRVEDARYREATLTEPSTWAEGTFQRTPYRKGALALAALDAEIDNRTGGVKSLQDVFAYRFDDDQYGSLKTYENFSAAVVAVTNDPSMRDWLDRYVAGPEAPPVPSDPGGFVLNASMDSDDDGVTNAAEVSTNPFQADTDQDGFDDADDAYPTDDTRYQTATTTQSTTTQSTTTQSTTTAVDAGDGGDGTAGTTTRSADATSDDRTTSATGTTDAGTVQDAGDSIPGFGVGVAVLAVVMTTVVLGRRD
jgi:PGF-CTERM protein